MYKNDSKLTLGSDTFVRFHISFPISETRNEMKISKFLETQFLKTEHTDNVTKK